MRVELIIEVDDDEIGQAQQAFFEQGGGRVDSIEMVSLWYKNQFRGTASKIISLRRLPTDDEIRSFADRVKLWLRSQAGLKHTSLPASPHKSLIHLDLHGNAALDREALRLGLHQGAISRSDVGNLAEGLSFAFAGTYPDGSPRKP